MKKLAFRIKGLGLMVVEDTAFYIELSKPIAALFAETEREEFRRKVHGHPLTIESNRISLKLPQYARDAFRSFFESTAGAREFNYFWNTPDRLYLTLVVFPGIERDARLFRELASTLCKFSKSSP